MTIAHVYNKQDIHVYVTLDRWQFKIMTACSQPHGARRPKCLCVEVIEAMTCVAAMMKQIVLSILQ